MSNTKHIYIHWPFCKNKCSYCDFTSFANSEEYQKDYCDALCNEIKNYYQNNVCEIETIFLGGGSPSLCPPDYLEKIIEVLDRSKKPFRLRQGFDGHVDRLMANGDNLGPDHPEEHGIVQRTMTGVSKGGFHRTDSNKQEITIEANPFDITEEKLILWKRLGINRLSIGIQILDSKILEKLNRRQTSKDVFFAMNVAPKYFDNISVDLILGLPGVSEKKWQETLDQIVKFPIKHVSVYFLTLYEKTPLCKLVKNGDVKLLSDDQLVDQYEKTVSFLSLNKFKQYEISNFAKKGYESIHNQAYWTYKPYIGFGLAAASFDGKKRFVNTKNLKNYVDCWLKHKSCDKKHDLVEELTDEQMVLEQLMLGLRMNKGVDLHRMIYLLSRDKREKFLQNVSTLKSWSMVKEIKGKIFLTTRGITLESEIALKLLA